jgi:ubiquinone/menaquinone biosynthesis C-methylase UbiE
MKNFASVNKSLDQVHDFWNEKSCGEIYAIGGSLSEQYQSEIKKRYELEPYIKDFAQFELFNNLDVLEIGVGMASDHSSIAYSSPKNLYGVDLTERAVEHTKARFKALGLSTNVTIDNAENLTFKDNQFDAIYSWGVLHHSINTPKCFDEVYRVLKPGGYAKIMIYHKYSPTGLMLWLRYGLFRFKSMKSIYSDYLESPGTKAYTLKEAKELTAKFQNVDLQVQICFGDLLEGEAGQRHNGLILSIARIIYPRRFIKWLSKKIPFGLYLLINVKK